MAFLGLSGSIVNEVGKTVSGWVKNPFNRNFFYWYFFPALAFILFHQFVIRPLAFNEHPPSLIDYANRAFATPAPAAEGEAAPAEETALPEATATPAPSDFALPEDTGSSGDYFTALFIGFLGADLFTYILVPFVMAIGLNAIAFQITRFYEGFTWPLSWLLAPFKLKNLAKSKELYGPLAEKRLKYLALYRAERKAAEAEAAAPPGAEALAPVDAPKAKELQKQLKDIKREIQTLHEAMEKKGSLQSLPCDPNRVTGAALGNTLAVAEEYPFDRYGIDSVLFWPRLRAELDEQTLLPLDTAKGQVDGMLNFSMLSHLAMVESIAVIFFIPVALRGEAWRVWALIGVAVVAAFVGFAAYRGAVGAAAAMGSMLRTYFDYHRDKVLEKFSLRRPDKLEDEKIIWYKLSAFLRRGESFYFPEDTEND